MAILVAHRGFRSTNGENRIVDFINALKTCKAVEFDIRMTKDEKIIIFHDNDFKRIGNENKTVNSLSYQEIKNLDFFKNNPDFLPPLLINDFAKNLANKYQVINVEIKAEVNRNYSNKELEIIFSEIKNLTFYTEAEIIVSSFNQNLLDEINKRIQLPIKTGYLFNTKENFNENYAKKFDYIHPSIKSALNQKMISKLKILNKPLNIWTFKTNKQAEKINQIYQEQVKGYISDIKNLKWTKEKSH